MEREHRRPRERRLRERLRALEAATAHDAELKFASWPSAAPAQCDRNRGALVETALAHAHPAGAPPMTHDGELWCYDEFVIWPEFTSKYAETSVAARSVEPDSDATQLYLDLETMGLARSHGIFMAGYLLPEPGGVRLLQELAADPAEEFHLLARARARLVARPRAITFNGRGFDFHALARRLRFHALEPLPTSIEVIDLLPAARRCYKRRFADFRLSTLERELLGCQRGAGDVPGSEAPLRYQDFQDSGRLERLAPILHHNRLDLCALVLLKQHLDRAVALAQSAAAESDASSKPTLLDAGSST
ncbi:MAG: ribonuclease H-like domain-containing protein [Planctomycetota bacterium]